MDQYRTQAVKFAEQLDYSASQYASNELRKDGSYSNPQAERERQIAITLRALLQQIENLEDDINDLQETIGEQSMELIGYRECLERMQ